MEAFNQSLAVDKRLYRQDILGSMAHVAMLGKQGIIPQYEADQIRRGLQGILADIEAGSQEVWISTAEDIHTNIEQILVWRIGEVGKKLHTGRSRNDQVALDLRMYVKEATQVIQQQLHTLQTTLLDVAKEHTETLMPGYTHLQRAQPVTLAHHLMAYFEMLVRDRQRLHDCYNRTDVMPLGSGALAGTTYPLDRYAVARELGFSDITANSLDAVSDRDFCIELVSSLSILMMHLSRISEELVLWSSQEFNFIAIDERYATGSSMMPHKHNPDAVELIRGKTGRVYGSLINLLTMMKALPLAYNKDMQEDKEAVFDAIDTVQHCLPILTAVLSTMTVKEDVMLKAAQSGFTNATDVADYLVNKGLAFRDAYQVVGKLVRYCIQYNLAIEELKLKEFQQFSPLFDKTIYEAISLQQVVNRRNLPGGPAPEAVKQCFVKNENYLAFRKEQLGEPVAPGPNPSVPSIPAPAKLALA
jgi:argininosuccinate lyase